MESALELWGVTRKRSSCKGSSYRGRFKNSICHVKIWSDFSSLQFMVQCKFTYFIRIGNMIRHFYDKTWSVRFIACSTKNSLPSKSAEREIWDRVIGVLLRFHCICRVSYIAVRLWTVPYFSLESSVEREKYFQFPLVGRGSGETKTTARGRCIWFFFSC